VLAGAEPLAGSDGGAGSGEPAVGVKGRAGSADTPRRDEPGVSASARANWADEPESATARQASTVAGAARARRAAGAPVVVVAHAFVAGAAESESERDLAVGGAAHVRPRTFEGADYVALGHLHGPQVIAAGRGRYAGSPLAFSFSEAAQRKSVAIVELAGAGAQPQTELLATPQPRALATVRGTLDELLADPRLREHEAAWVQATLTDPVRPSDAMERLRRRFPHAVVLQFDPQGAAGAPGDSYQRLRGLADEELLQQFVADVRGSDADDEELTLLRDALTARRIADAEGEPARAAA
jgi:exonuclease SbcD